MATLLHEQYDLEENASRKLKAWKVWHIILFTAAAGFGALNYIFLFNTMRLVDNNSVLYPRKLEFRLVDISNTIDKGIGRERNASETDRLENSTNFNIRNILENNTTNDTERTVIVNNVTIVTENKTHHLMLDTSRSLFGNVNDCEYAQYMPIFSTIFAITWICLFTMCPGGGKSRTGLQQPWRILAPAIFLTLICVGLTGYSFTTTNRGLLSFCHAFHDYTNASTCSAVDPYIERARSSWLGFSGWSSATRAASAGVWASWACAAALLLARCLAAPDFTVRKTSVYLKDPQKTLIPYIRTAKGGSPKRKSETDLPKVKSGPSQATEATTTVVVEQTS